tara:strand:+ start:5986 stop:8325 length:2340 start_codon:yes stop_codon:yes gene_type:complete
LKNFKKHLILLIIPILFGLLISYLYNLRGPHFIQIPQDLAYQSIFNALNLINGEPPGMLLYPAITLNYINLIIIYFYNLFFGGDIINSSIQNIEFLCRILSFLTSCILIFLIFISGLILRKKNFPYYLILFYQSSLLFTTPLDLLLNLYISAESIILIIGMSLILSIKIYENNYNTKFIFISSILCSLVVLTKFTALPFFLLPLFLVDGFKNRIRIIIISFLFSSFFIFAIILFYNNAEYFYDLIIGIYYGIQTIFSSSQVERYEISSNIINNIYFQQIQIFKSFSISFYLFFFNIFLITFMKLKKINLNKNIFVYLFVILIFYIYLSIRPKPHYFLIIQLFNFFFVIETLNIFLKSKFSLFFYNSKKSVIILTLLIILVNLINLNSFVKNPILEQIKISKKDIGTIKSIYKNKEGKKALISAVPSSNIGSGFYHANERRLHLNEILNKIPNNEFNYNFSETENIFTQKYNKISIKDVLKKYDNVYFWSGKDKFKNIVSNEALSTQKGPNLLYKKIYNGQWESIAEIIGVNKGELQYEESMCQNKVCYKINLNNNEEYNGLGIKFKNINLKSGINSLIIKINGKKKDFTSFIGPWNSNYFSQIFFEEEIINTIEIVSEKKINKIYSYQNIDSYNSSFEYIPKNVFEKYENESFKETKEFNFKIKKNSELIFNFDEEIDPKFIEIFDISKHLKIKTTLYGLKKNGEFVLLSVKESNNHNIIYKKEDISLNYSSYKFVFEIIDFKKTDNSNLKLIIKNKLKNMLLNYNPRQGTISSINFIY